MRGKVKKRTIRESPNVPAPIMEAVHLEIDQEVDSREEDGVVTVAPVLRVSYDLNAMIAGITDDNRHEMESFGELAGKELW